MEVTSHTYLQTRLQNFLFIVLLATSLGIIAWLSVRYTYQVDMTMNNRYTLSEMSQQLLKHIDGPVTITGYFNNNDSSRRNFTQKLITRYQQHKSDLVFKFVDPDMVPGEVRQHGIKYGDLVINYQGRTEHVSHYQLSEQELTTALQRVIRTNNHNIVFLEGHGERSSEGMAKNDLTNWTQQLTSRGFNITTANFAKNHQIPDDTGLLVIAGPMVKLLPGEVTLLSHYIDQGGNLLWLLDPGDLQGLEPLAEKLGLTVQPGTVVDLVGQLYGDSEHPAILTINQYGQHPITTNFPFLTLFPQSSGLLVELPFDEWEQTTLLTTNHQAWSETGEEIKYNQESDIEGPFDIGVALSRDVVLNNEDDVEIEPEEITDKIKNVVVESEEGNISTVAGKTELDIQETSIIADESDHHGHDHESEIHDGMDEVEAIQQRIIIVGDGDFLSNTFLHYSGNLDLGLKMVNWLVRDEIFLDIPAKVASDLKLQLSNNDLILLRFIFLLLLPLGLISIGIMIWSHRRKA
ncbi:Gldg family protein [Candidatus Parabeggiatoa sp. HSG14]|uniref:GldG family protein n=1 Tax=Candidatus Parabeggiatoa sp. HSG14 TaxID=3055593 RepID=UPI0025A73FC4|nr:Gldg family protein [Thiotrichales bacterium HSG14]